MSQRPPTLEQVLERARRCRRHGFDRPLVDDAEGAAAVSREIAARLAALPATDRSLLISDVEVLQAVLAGRLSALRLAMGTGSAEVIALVQGMSARRAYLGGQALGRATDAGRRR